MIQKSVEEKGEVTEGLLVDRAFFFFFISLWLISAHASPQTIFSGPKWRAHKDNLTVFLLHFPPELNSIPSVFFLFSFAPSVAADYDVHSLLSPRLRLASNQRPALHSYSPCYCSPDHSRAHHCLLFLPSFHLRSGLLSLVWGWTFCWLWTNNAALASVFFQHN